VVRVPTQGHAGGPERKANYCDGHHRFPSHGEARYLFRSRRRRVRPKGDRHDQNSHWNVWSSRVAPRCGSNRDACRESPGNRRAARCLHGRCNNAVQFSYPEQGADRRLPREKNVPAHPSVPSAVRQELTGPMNRRVTWANIRGMDSIEAMPKAKHLAFLVTERGEAFTAAGFGNWLRDQCD
jgi:hypothetical protein